MNKYLSSLPVAGLWLASLCFSQDIAIRVERNRTLVPVRIGGSRTLKIILDTGMAFDGLLIYNPDLRDSIGLRNTMSVRIPGAGGGEPSEGIMADSASFYLGDQELKNQRIIVLTGDTYRGFPSDGVMGYSVFGHYTVELDYDAAWMRLHPQGLMEPDASWTPVPITFKGNLIPWLDISVIIESGDPIPLSVYLDFASGHALELLERPDMKFVLPEMTESAYLGRGLSGDIYGKRGQISVLNLGPYRFSDVVTAFAPANIRSRQDRADGILGNDLLRRFNIIFIYAEKMLYIKPNSRFSEPFKVPGRAIEDAAAE